MGDMTQIPLTAYTVREWDRDGNLVSETRHEIGRYTVKCDDCKTEIKQTDSMRESVAGGLCESCRHDANEAAARWAAASN